MIQLKSLEIQLESLKEVLEDAKRKNQPLEKISEIIGRIKVLEILIDKRKAFLRRSQDLN